MKNDEAKKVLDELEKMDASSYHRGKSWEHCYCFFRKYKKFGKDIELTDLAALNLGFFLASWGMFRGSSFLLQQYYKFFVPAVEVLIQSKYDKLWEINWSRLNERERIEGINLLFDLNDRLKEEMKKNNKSYKEPTETLITKIIMATMGVTPAYDTYFKRGLKKSKIKKCRNFNKHSFGDLLSLCSENTELKWIYITKRKITGTDIIYPSMKLLDLHFWLLGYEGSKLANNKLEE